MHISSGCDGPQEREPSRRLYMDIRGAGDDGAMVLVQKAKIGSSGAPQKVSGARARSALALYTARAQRVHSQSRATQGARSAPAPEVWEGARSAPAPEVRECASHTSTLAQFTDGGARCAAQQRGARSASALPQATGREKARQNSHRQPAAQLPKLMCGRIATTSARTPQ